MPHLTVHVPEIKVPKLLMVQMKDSHITWETKVLVETKMDMVVFVVEQTVEKEVNAKEGMANRAKQRS